MSIRKTGTGEIIHPSDQQLIEDEREALADTQRESLEARDVSAGIDQEQAEN